MDCKHFILPSPLRGMRMSMPDIFKYGWGNGYVILPKGHKYNGTGYDDIHCNVHCGLTFSRSVKDCNEISQFAPMLTDEPEDSWVIGFDTAHYNDDETKWPKEAVEAEAIRLKEQMERR